MRGGLPLRAGGEAENEDGVGEGLGVTAGSIGLDVRDLDDALGQGDEEEGAVEGDEGREGEDEESLGGGGGVIAVADGVAEGESYREGDRQPEKRGQSQEDDDSCSKVRRDARSGKVERVGEVKVGEYVEELEGGGKEEGCELLSEV